jgi:hypothetical protein
MAGWYQDGALSPALDESQGPSTIEYDYTDGPVVPAGEDTVQSGPMVHDDTEDVVADENYRAGPFTADEADRVAAGGDEFTTTETVS